MKRDLKKSVMNQIIGIFILILIVSVLAGMTFIFVSQLKTEVEDNTATTAGSVANESGAWFNGTGYKLAGSYNLASRGFSVYEILANGSVVVPVGNVSVNTAGVIVNTTSYTADNLTLSYNYNYISNDSAKAYNAVNKTETAGYNITKYLTLLFLALIFGAVLVVVLRIILPYINLSNQMTTV